MVRRRSIWRYSALLLTTLLVSAICLILIFFDPPPPRSRYDDPPPPPNAVSTHILDAKSGRIELVRLVAEKDWEAACIVEEIADPGVILERDFKIRIASTTQPLIDEEWKDHLWKIVVVKGDKASVYYLDNRRIGRLGEASCLPLDRALLTYEPDADRVNANLVDKDAPRK